jgi:zinc transporter ZupT
MGDVAILMTNKFTGIQTILCNGTVNIMSLLGVLVGTALNSLNDATQQYILVFVAGNFMYIASDIWKHLFQNHKMSINLMEFAGFSIGICSMYGILWL